MRLTLFSDYALRLLILAGSDPVRHVTIEEAATLYGISAPHLKKVVRTLVSEGILEARRGRGGGVRLARPPEEINLGRVLRATEPDFALVECFGPANRCRITGVCRLPGIVSEALRAMLAVFDRHTLADILLESRVFDAVAEAAGMPDRGGPPS